MAVLPESGGPTNSRALPLDFDFPRVYDMTRSGLVSRGIRRTRCNGPMKRNKAIVRESNPRLAAERLPTSGETSGVAAITVSSEG